MEFHVLDANFQPAEVLDTFVSAIWTERYTSAGDVNLIVEASDQNVSQLVPDTFLRIPESKEIMILDTAIIEDSLLKVTGYSLSKFLNHRVIGGPISYRPFGIAELPPYAECVNLLEKPGKVMTELVRISCIAGFSVASSGRWAYVGDILEGQVIPNLSIGAIDTSGPDYEFTSKFTYLYPVLEEIAQTYNVGFSLYLDSYVPPNVYSLVFKTYTGQDKTNSVVFSPTNDTLVDVKLLTSQSDAKNDIFSVMFKDNDPSSWVSAVTYIREYKEEGDTKTGFDRKIGYLPVSDITIPSPPYTESFLVSLDNILQQRVVSAFGRENNTKKIVDGMIVPQRDTDELQFGVDFNLGDVVKLEAYGYSQNVRVTEFIRSHDAEGEKAYPTVEMV